MTPTASIFDTDRNEEALYETSPYNDFVKLPLTYKGFEALYQRICKEEKLPNNDDILRKGLAGYVHSLERGTHEILMETAGQVLYRAVANALTWEIHEALKEKLTPKTTPEPKSPELSVVTDDVGV